MIFQKNLFILSEKVMAVNDYILLQQIKRGNPDAWDTLVDKYYELIFSYCVRRCYGNRQVAADLTQDIFLKLIENISSYHFSGNFFNFLFTIAVNTCHNYYNKKKLTQIEFDENILSKEDNFVEQNILNKEQNKQIQQMLNSLPPIQRDAIVLKYFYDLKVKDIANITGVGIATAQSSVNQGLKKLRASTHRKDWKNGKY